MKNKKIVLSFLFVIFTSMAFGQTPIVYNQYFFEKTVYNPAYSNIKKHPTASLLYNNRWANVKGSPENFCIAFSSPIPNKNAGAGAYYNRNNIGLMTNEEFNLNYAYSIKLNDDYKIHLGGGAGIHSIRFNLNAADLSQPNDPKLLAIQNTPSKSKVNVRFGAALSSNNFSVGLSANRLLKQDYFYDYNSKSITYSVQQFYTADMEYNYQINKDNYLIPYINTYFSNDYKKLLFTGGLSYNYKKKIWIGVGTYSFNNIQFYLGAVLSDAFKLGLSRVMPLSGGANKLGASNEIVASVTFGTNRKNSIFTIANKTDTVYSIKEKVVVKDRIIKDTIIEKVFVNVDSNKIKKDVYIDVKRKNKTVLFGSKSNLKPSKAVKFDEYKKLKPKELAQIDTTKITFVDVSNESLDKAHYIIIGGFKVQKYADSFIKKLLSKGTAASKIYRKDRNYFYVILDKTQDHLKAENIRDINAEKFPGIWIYTVNK